MSQKPQVLVAAMPVVCLSHRDRHQGGVAARSHGSFGMIEILVFDFDLPRQAAGCRMTLVQPSARLSNFSDPPEP